MSRVEPRDVSFPVRIWVRVWKKKNLSVRNWTCGPFGEGSSEDCGCRSREGLKNRDRGRVGYRTKGRDRRSWGQKGWRRLEERSSVEGEVRGGETKAQVEFEVWRRWRWERGMRVIFVMEREVGKMRRHLFGRAGWDLRGVKAEQTNLALIPWQFHTRDFWDLEWNWLIPLWIDPLNL